MKGKRKTSIEPPLEVRNVIDDIISAERKDIAKSLSKFTWKFEEGDMYHWVDLIDYFDESLGIILEKHKELSLGDVNSPEVTDLPKDDIQQILRVCKVLMENCSNRHVVNFSEHLNLLLVSSDVDVVIASLEFLAAQMKKTYEGRGGKWNGDPMLSSKIFSLSQGWGGKEEGLGLLECASAEHFGIEAETLATTLHFEFYKNSPNKDSKEEPESQGLEVIHIPDVHKLGESSLSIAKTVAEKYSVPENLRFSLLTRIRFAMAFLDQDLRHKLVEVRLLATTVLAQSTANTEEMTALFWNEPELVSELTSLMRTEENVPQIIRCLAVNCLTALSDKPRISNVLTILLSGGQTGILYRVLEKAVSHVASEQQPSDVSLDFLGSVLHLVCIIFLTHSAGLSSFRSSALVAVLVPLIKSLKPEQTSLLNVCSNVLAIFVEYSSTASSLFRSLGGLNTIDKRLCDEIQRIVEELRRLYESREEEELSIEQFAVMKQSLSYTQKDIVKSLIRAVFLAGLETIRMGEMNDLSLPQSLCTIFTFSEMFGGNILSESMLLLTKILHTDPTCYPKLQEASLPDAFLKSLSRGIPPNASAIMALPDAIGALCLNADGLEKVTSSKALTVFSEIFTSPKYAQLLNGEAANNIGTKLDELLRHNPQLRPVGVNISLKILKNLKILGGGVEIEDSEASKSDIPEEVSREGNEVSIMKHDSIPPLNLEDLSELRQEKVEKFLQDSIVNVLKMLEHMLSTSETSRMFVEAKGIQAILELYTMPKLSHRYSGSNFTPNLCSIFRSFGHQNSAAVSQAVASFVEDYMGKIASEIVVKLEGQSFFALEEEERHNLARKLHTVDFLLSITSLLCKTSSSMLLDISLVATNLFSSVSAFYRTILWQLSLIEAEGEVSSSTLPSEEQTEYKDLLSNVSACLNVFFVGMGKALAAPLRRRDDSVVSTPAKIVADSIAIAFKRSISLYSSSLTADPKMIPPKCQVLGKVLVDFVSTIFDKSKSIANSVLLNVCYVRGTFQEAFIAFSNISRLLDSLKEKDFLLSSNVDGEIQEWLRKTMREFIKLFEQLADSSLILGSNSFPQFLSQEIVDDGSIELFKDSESFARGLRKKVFEHILPLWKNPSISLLDEDAIKPLIKTMSFLSTAQKRKKPDTSSVAATVNSNLGQDSQADDAEVVSSLTEMGFSRSRAEQALRGIDTSTRRLESAMEWLLTHPEGEVNDDDELQMALAMSMSEQQGLEVKEEGKVQSEKEEKKVEELNEDEERVLELEDVLETSWEIAKTSNDYLVPLTEFLLSVCRNEEENMRKLVVFLLGKFEGVSTEEILGGDSVLASLCHLLSVLFLQEDVLKQIAHKEGIFNHSMDCLATFLLDAESFCKKTDEGILQSPKWVSMNLLMLDCLQQFKALSQKDFEGLLIQGTGEKEEALFTTADSLFSGYLTFEEQNKLLECLIRLCRMNLDQFANQATLQLLARLTRNHELALKFFNSGAFSSLLLLPKSAMFPGFMELLTSITRHILEDPVTLQVYLENEIRGALNNYSKRSGYRNGVPTNFFFSHLIPHISRKPSIFVKAMRNICQLKKSGSDQSLIILATNEEKQRQSVTSPGEVEEQKGDGKSQSKALESMPKSAGKKKIPPTFVACMDVLIDSIMHARGQSFAGDTGKGLDQEKNLPRATYPAECSLYALKVLTNILPTLHAGYTVIVKRDSDPGQREGFLRYIIRELIGSAVEKSLDPKYDKSTDIGVAASFFLVVLCVKSTEGRRKVFGEIVAFLKDEAEKARNSGKVLIPSRKLELAVGVFWGAVTFIQSVGTSTNANTDLIVKAIQNAGATDAATVVLDTLDLDHPTCTKLLSLLVKMLECTTRIKKSSDEKKTQERNPEQERRTEDLAGRSNSTQEEQPAVTEGSERVGQEEIEMQEEEEGGGVEGEDQAIVEEDNNDLWENRSDFGNEMEGMLRVPLDDDDDDEDDDDDDDDDDDGQDEGDEDDEEEDEEEREEDMGGIEAGIEIREHMLDQIEEEIEALQELGHMEPMEEIEEDQEDVEEEVDEEGDDEGDAEEEEGGEEDDDEEGDEEDDDDEGDGDDYEERDEEHGEHEIGMREIRDGDDFESESGSDDEDRGALRRERVLSDPFELLASDEDWNPPDAWPRWSQADVPRRIQMISRGDRVLVMPNTSLPGDDSRADTLLQNLDNLLGDGMVGDDRVNRLEDLLRSTLRVMDVSNRQRVIISALHRASGLRNEDSARQAVTHPLLMRPNSNRSRPGNLSENLDNFLLSGRHPDSFAPFDSRSGELTRSETMGIPRLFRALQRGNVTSRGDTNLMRFAPGSADPISSEVFQQLQTFLSSSLPSVEPSQPPAELAEARGEDEPSEETDRGIHRVDGQRPYSPRSPTYPGAVGGSQEAIQPARSDGSPSSESSSSSEEEGEGSEEQVPQIDTTNEVEVVADGEPSSAQTSPDLENRSSSPVEPTSPSTNDLPSGSVPPPNREESPTFAQVTLPSPPVAEPTLPLPPAPESSQPSGGIDPAFLEALPPDLRDEVLASHRAETQTGLPGDSLVEDLSGIDQDFLAALPPDLRAEVISQQRAARTVATVTMDGQPVDMDSASIIATLEGRLREEVLLTTSEQDLAMLPPALVAEAQLLRERAIHQYHRPTLTRVQPVTGGRRYVRSTRVISGEAPEENVDAARARTWRRRLTDERRSDEPVADEIDNGPPLISEDSLKPIVRLLRLAKSLGKGGLQRLFLNICAHQKSRRYLLHLLLKMLNPSVSQVEGQEPLAADGVPIHRLYGCLSNVVYSRLTTKSCIPPLVSRRILELLSYLTRHEREVGYDLLDFRLPFREDSEEGKDEKIPGPGIILKLLDDPLYQRSSVHLEQAVALVETIARTVKHDYLKVLELAGRSEPETSHAPAEDQPEGGSSGGNTETVEADAPQEQKSGEEEETKPVVTIGGKHVPAVMSLSSLPHEDIKKLCHILTAEGLADSAYHRVSSLLRTLSTSFKSYQKIVVAELTSIARKLCESSTSDIEEMAGRKPSSTREASGFSLGGGGLRVLHALAGSLPGDSDRPFALEPDSEQSRELDPQLVFELNLFLNPLWEVLSSCASQYEGSLPPPSSHENAETRASQTRYPLPQQLQKLLPYVEIFFQLNEKLQGPKSKAEEEEGKIANASPALSPGPASDSSSISRFVDKHRRLLNAYVRQNPSVLDGSLKYLVRNPKLLEFDNKLSYFRSSVKKQQQEGNFGSLKVTVRRQYILEDSFNQLRMRTAGEMKGRLTVQFQGEAGVDAGGLTREWFHALGRAVFDKNTLLFTTVGSDSTFQPNPNSVFQTEHLSYFKFFGRVVAKALFDGQLLDAHFTRSFYKHLLGRKVTYHDIEAIDPEYYKSLKWLLENNCESLCLTFSIDADEEKRILYEKVGDHELIPGGSNVKVTDENKHEYVNLVAEYRLTEAIRPQINSFLEGFYELIPRNLISLFNDKELELAISGLPQIDIDDLKANTEYSGFAPISPVVMWFWEVVQSFSAETKARLLQFITGTSKVPLEGFANLQGIQGTQRFQIHKDYGSTDRLPSAHTCFNQLDLPEYESKEKLQERLLMAIHEGGEGFGFA